MLCDAFGIINTHHACTARITVLGLSFCPFVCLSVCYHVFCHYAPKSDTKEFSAVLA